MICISPVRYYKVKGKYKYVLNSRVLVQTTICPDENIVTEYVSILRSGLMILEKGYAWNGPNMPAIHTKNSIIGSLPHDGGYQLLKLGLLDQSWRIDLDWMLGELVAKPYPEQKLLNRWRRFRGDYYFFSVDLFGYKYSHQESLHA